MKTKPILFSTQMVQSIMNGSKTQTRRIIKPITTEISALLMNIYTGADVERSKEELIRTAALVQKDDILWVRETFADGLSNKEPYAYKATSKWDGFEDGTPESFKDIKWKPSIFMPKEACRNFLKATNVRVEILQDISEEDALAEGVLKGYGFEQFHNYLKSGDKWKNSAIDSFESLWISINGKESWDLNPCVFVYDFEKTEKPKDFV
jgi:hypothetical protein